MNVHLVDGTFELFQGVLRQPAEHRRRRQGGRRRARARALDARVARRARRHARRYRVRSRHRVVPQRFVSRLQDRRRHRSRALRPVRSGRGRVPRARDRHLADDRVRVRRRARDSGGALRRDAGRRARRRSARPDKDLTQCVRGERVVCFDRMRRKRLDERGVVEKFGVDADVDSRIGSRSSATAPTAIPASRAGARSRRRPCSARTSSLEAIPADAADWSVPVRGAAALAASFATHRTDAFLFRQLATLRTDVPLAGVARRPALARARMLRR